LGLAYCGADLIRSAGALGVGRTLSGQPLNQALREASRVDRRDL